MTGIKDRIFTAREASSHKLPARQVNTNIKPQAAIITNRLSELTEIGLRRTETGYYYIAHYPPLRAMDDVGADHAKILLGMLSGTSTEAYVHFPFCEIKCSFCHFHKELHQVSRPEISEDALLAAIVREMELTTTAIGKVRAHSFYVGGGTPSLMSIDNLNRLFRAVSTHLEIAPDAEIKFEIYPKLDTSHRQRELLTTLRAFGVTDVVIDLESGNQQSLDFVGRRNSSLESYLKTVEQCVSHGFKSIVTGLIIGLPFETEASLLRTLDALIAIPEVSVINTFPLITRYPDPIWRQRKDKSSIFHDAESRDRLCLFARNYLRDRGFSEGPISYLRRPSKTPQQQFDKFECANLIAFGPSGFGYINGTHTAAQYFNLCTNAEYISSVSSGKLPMWRAGVLDPAERLRRRVIFALANCRPVDLLEIEREFDCPLDPIIGQELNALLQLKLIERTNKQNTIRYTEVGLCRLEELSYFLGSNTIKDRVAVPVPLDHPHHLQLMRHNYYIEIQDEDRRKFESLIATMPSEFMQPPA